MKARAFAIAVAILLVVGALVVRREVIDDGDADRPDDRASELVCITELAAVCRSYADSDTAVEVTIEDAGVTLDRLAGLEDDADVPLWLTVEPYPEMVESIRSGARGQPLGYTTTVLGASPLAIALPRDGRLDVLTAACTPELLWRCIGANAGSPWADLGGESTWGTIRPAFGDVDNSALALASFAASVAGYLNDVDVSRNRWEADTGSFLPWLGGLADTASGVSLSGGSALGTMATRPSALDIAATADFELDAVDAGSDRFASNYPAPQMWLQAVLATPGGDAAPGDVVDDLGALLDAAGWDPAASATTPLPSGPTMLALRTLWREAA